MKPMAIKQEAEPDAELRRVLNEWDDKDADALTASKARLDAIGTEADEQLVSLLRRRIRLYRRILWFACGNLVPLIVILIGWCAQHNSREPFPVLLNCTLVLLGATAYISFFAAMWAVGDTLPVKAAKALAEQTTGQHVGVLAEHRCAAGALANDKTGLGKAPLLKAVENLLTNGNASDLQFSKYQRRCLRRLLLGPHTRPDLACALIRLLTRLEDQDALAPIHRLAVKSRNWEVREAAQDYIARIAPAEAVKINRPGAWSEAQLFSVGADGVEADNIPACIMALGSRSDAERRAAETMIRRMEPEQIRQVLLLLDQEPDARQRRRDRVTIIAVMLATPLLSIAWFPLLLRLPYFDSLLAMKAMFGLMLVGLPIGWLIGLDIVRWQRNRRRALQLGFRRMGVFPARRLLDTLKTLDNTALVGTLTDALSDVSAELSSLIDLETNRALYTALTTLLPRLQASDANLLNTAQRARLNHELTRGKQVLHAAWRGASQAEAQVALDVAILKAWEQVGDEHALPVVQKLAAQTARTPAQKRVQQAAQSCLPYLEVRAGEQRASEQLLRASSAHATPNDILLRPAEARTDAAPEQLLRAGETPQ